jgi:hypothetical protein
MQKGKPMRSHLIRLAVVGLLAMPATIGAAAAVAAQDATPSAAAAGFPISPDPADCTGEPRSVDELLALWYGPDGSPIAAAGAAIGEAADATSLTIPVGAPADEATAAAVLETVSQIFACFEAGDPLRAYAWFSDDLSRLFGPEPGTPREDAEVFLSGEFEPEEGGEASEIVAVTDVMDLDDGRVGAFVVESSGGRFDTVYAIFERDGDRLIADEIIDFVSLEEDE